jgi:hypothetical protein
MFHKDVPISSYSRAEALKDGVLVDVSETAKEAGFRIPVALTQSVYTKYVKWTADDDARTGALQNQSGRLWDVLWMAFIAIRSKRNENASDYLCYQLHVVPRDVPYREATPPLVTLKLGISGGDDASPVITIMEPDED